MSRSDELLDAWKAQSGGEGARLREWVSAVERGWPDVDLPSEEFVRFLGERLAPEGDLWSSIERVAGEDLYLACACAAGNERAIAAFDRLFLSQVPAFLSKLSLTAAGIEEVRQQLRIKLLVAAPRPRIQDYSGRGALGSWLRVVAIRTALDLADRDRRLGGRSDELSGEQLEKGDPEVAYLKELYRDVFEEAYRAAFAALSSEERNLLRGYFVDGLTVEQLGVLVGVNKSTVSRRLVAARRNVFRETRKRMQAKLRLSPAETSSLIRLIRSQIRVSARSCLGEGPGQTH